MVPLTGRYPAGYVLGVQARLDCMPGHLRGLRLVRERLARRDPQLELHQVQAGDELGDGVLDLEPGVDLKEVEAAAAVQHELDGARAGVADRLAGRHGSGAELLAQLVVDGGEGASSMIF